MQAVRRVRHIESLLHLILSKAIHRHMNRKTIKDYPVVSGAPMATVGQLTVIDAGDLSGVPLQEDYPEYSSDEEDTYARQNISWG